MDNSKNSDFSQSLNDSKQIKIENEKNINVQENYVMKIESGNESEKKVEGDDVEKKIEVHQDPDILDL